MPWDERQLAMLREMGVPAWLPTSPSPAAPAAAVAAAPDSPAVPTAVAVAVREPAAQRQATPRTEGPVVAAPPASHRVVTPIAAAPATAGAWSAMGWDDLRAAVAACQACSLGSTRRQTVFGVGHPQAHWMIVGEAPGEQEDLRGEPFVGAAGQLLDRMLQAIGVTRAEAAADGAPALTPAQQAYIANTLKCRPPRNRNPEPGELAQCEPFLVRQIELLQPRVILAMGRFAVQALLRTDEAIGRLRGRVHRYQGVPLIVTYHPAYLLRNPVDKAKAWDDLCLAAHTMDAARTP
jgi:uracil-DNA glycosylase